MGARDYSEEIGVSTKGTNYDSYSTSEGEDHTEKADKGSASTCNYSTYNTSTNYPDMYLHVYCDTGWHKYDLS